jgi:hypothetical protein
MSVKVVPSTTGSIVGSVRVFFFTPPEKLVTWALSASACGWRVKVKGSGVSSKVTSRVVESEYAFMYQTTVSTAVKAVPIRNNRIWY